MVVFSNRFNPTNARLIKSPTQLTGDLDSGKLYIIDGAIDMGDDSIDVPEGGIQIAGLGFDVSSLSANGTLFTYSGAYAGSVQLQDLAITAATVFDLDNDENLGAVEGQAVNFVGCASLGELTSYRQGLWSGSALINCTDGLTMSGTWLGGFAIVDSIIIGGFTGTAFKSGTALDIQGSFRSNINALDIAIGGAFCDFAPSNIDVDGGFTMEGVRVSPGVTAFPNMPRSNVKARYRNCLGQANTYPGGQWVISASAATSVAAADTLYKLAGTTTYADMQWFSDSGNNRFVYDSTQTLEVEIKAVLTFSGTNGDQVNTWIRQWDDSASGWIDLSQSGAATINASGRAEGVATFAYANLDAGDYIEVWIENLSGARDVTAQAGGLVGIVER